MSDSASQHRSAAPSHVGCGLLTVSDTRTLQTDRGGAIAEQMLKDAGHEVRRRELVKDEPAAIRSVVDAWQGIAGLDAILVTGGTGISRRDRTFETISQMLSVTLPGYGELFRMLSFEEIGAAAMLSRAVGGLIGSTVVLTMPGSTAAVRLAMRQLIIPELGHLVREATK